CFLDIVGWHLHEFGLRWRAGRGSSRQDQIRELVIGLESARLGVERRARDAGGLRFRPERCDELREGGIGGAGRRNARDNNGNENTEPCPSHFTATMKIRGKRNSTLPSACGR